MGATPKQRHTVVQPIESNFRFIALTKNQTCIVDREDFETLGGFLWIALWSPDSNSWYAIRNLWRDGKQCMEQMHRVITSAPRGMVVDHINHNTLDNRRENLRVVTRSQNQQNRCAQSNNLSGVPGVHYDKQRRKWMAFMKLQNKRIHLGRFASKEEAIVARKLGEAKYFGEFAYRV